MKDADKISCFNISSIPFCIVSACLCGIPCRYDGKSFKVAALVELYESGLALAVCPEVEGGLSIPRAPCEMKDGRMITQDEIDVTDQLRKGGAYVLKLAQESGINLAILKENSPSCGSGMIYDGSFSGRLIPGEGATTALLRQNGIRVYSEHNFQNIFS